ncbi:MAG TPA: hypothetical protein VG406_15215 [Isosphaeraceae bacterium]|jgi:hypothetical protein|nr:hypothetical protein [Isosphaeraceae bacterium]
MGVRDESEREYTYRPRWSIIALLTGACVFGAAVSRYAALHRDDVVVFHVIKLRPPEATTVWWLSCGICVAVAALGVLVAVDRLAHRRRIVIGRSAVTVPSSRWSVDETTIPFGEIEGLITDEIEGQRSLTIVHCGGKNTIAALMLPTREAFDEVVTALSARVRDAKEAGSS